MYGALSYRCRVIKEPANRLPRGRSALSPDEVRRIHRQRLSRAIAEAMAEKGYAATSVEDVLKRAGVSRRAFYEQFGSKLDCFLTAFDSARDILLGRMLGSVGVKSASELAEADDPLAGFETAMSAYLAAIAEELPFARLFLVESFAAGTEAVRRRMAVQDTIADAMAVLLRVTGPAGRFTCATVIAAASSMVTGLVADGDPDGILALGPALTGHVRRLWQMGAFAEPTEPNQPS
jgi:AcrR family transcriptional regulator